MCVLFIKFAKTELTGHAGNLFLKVRLFKYYFVIEVDTTFYNGSAASFT